MSRWGWQNSPKSSEDVDSFSERRSRSSVRKHMRVQVPPSAPEFFPIVLDWKTLAVKSSAQESPLTLAGLWRFL
jgi:hypothetical protein